MRRPLAPRLRLVLKAALVVVLLSVLTRKGFISLHATRRAFAHWDLMAPAIAALVGAMLISVLRWHGLLRGHGIALRPRRTLALAMIGNFFNLALPGAVSGDVVKAVYVAREWPGRRDDVLASILFDRVAGLSGLVLLAAAALLLEGEAVLGAKLVRGIQVIVTAAAVVVVAFYGHLFLVRDRHDPLLGFLRALERRVSRTRSVIRLYQALRRYGDDPRAVVRAVALSLAVHVLMCFAYLNLWRALEPVHAPMLALLVVVPVGLLATALPIAPAGIGTGHAAFGWLFLQIDSRMGANVFNLAVLFQLALAGVGGFVYLRYQRESAVPAGALAAPPDVSGVQTD